tara:strand:+ start:6550 stop:6678 length:129 start_codon:yes stop_codon:yes gene_type:complete
MDLSLGFSISSRYRIFPAEGPGGDARKLQFNDKENSQFVFIF